MTMKTEKVNFVDYATKLGYAREMAVEALRRRGSGQ